MMAAFTIELPKGLVTLLAIIGIAAVVFTIYTSVVLPKCDAVTVARSITADGVYVASLEQSVCEDPKHSESRVVIARPSSREKIVALLLSPETRDVKLTWTSAPQLLVAVPSSAVIKRYGPYDGWPKVIPQE